MKWIRRKPSVYNHCRVTAWCVFLLFASWTWVQVSYPGYHSRISAWVSPIFFGPHTTLARSAFQVTYAPHDAYWVAQRDGRYVILKEGDAGYETRATDPESFPLHYSEGNYQTGVWAPTRSIDAKLLGHYEQVFGPTPGVSSPSATIRVLEAQAALVASEGLDPRLATSHRTFDPRVIWIGYPINFVCLLASMGLVWALFWLLAWVPVKFREAKQRRRQASGLCPMCAYNLEGTPNRCPECGWRQGSATAN